MASETHVLVFPFPSQGHINPMLQFAKRLASKGVKATILVATSIRDTIHVQPSSDSVNIEYIHDGFDDDEKPKMTDEHLLRTETALKRTLPQLIIEMQQQPQKSDHQQPPKVLVYDSAMPWALGIAQGLGLKGAPFFTQTCTVSAIYYHFRQGHFEIDDNQESATFSLPAIPPLEMKDLPSFISDSGCSRALLSLVTNQFSNLERADWVFFNTFDKLEQEAVSWMQKQWRVKTIGPTIPSTYVDNRQHNDSDYGINLFKPTSAEACLKWLDTKEKASVVYASFGSLASLSINQMHELAWGLKDSECHFLLVVRETEQSKLPSNFMDENETSEEKGLVVKWCPQIEVLSHKSVGCFVTHCGWNSTIEAMSLGVPMVAMPQWSDQTTNAKCIVDVWRVGVRVQAKDKGSVTREAIKMSVKEVMEGDRGDEIRRNALRWKELARAAVDEGGSSDQNIGEFISEIS